MRPCGSRCGRPGRDGARVRRAASAVRVDARSARTAPGSSARCTWRRVRPEHRARARSLSRRPGRPEPAGRGRRGAPTGLPDRRWAVAGSCLGAGAGVRARRLLAESVGVIFAVRTGGENGTRPDSRSWWSKVSVRMMRGRCWPRSSGCRWTRRCATGSSPSRAEIRSRCSSCRWGWQRRRRRRIRTSSRAALGKS
jgi:hypothetical protein